MPRQTNKKKSKSQFHLPNVTFPWHINDIVEMKTKEIGYRGAWFRTEIKTIRQVKSGKLYSTVIYKDFPDESMEEIVAIDVDPLTKKSVLMFRPLPPPAIKESIYDETEQQNILHAILRDYWEVGDLVDWWYNDCWWSAEVLVVLGDGHFQLKCPSPPEGEGGVYLAKESDMRASLNWSLEEQWTTPPSKELGMKPCARLVGTVLNLNVITTKFNKPDELIDDKEHMNTKSENKTKISKEKLFKDDMNKKKDFNKKSLISRIEHKLQSESDKQSHVKSLSSFETLKNLYEDNKQDIFDTKKFLMVSSEASSSQQDSIKCIREEKIYGKQRTMTKIQDNHCLIDKIEKKQCKNMKVVKQSEHQLKVRIDLKGESISKQTTLRYKHPKKLLKMSFNKEDVPSKPSTSHKLQTLQVCSKNEDDSQIKCPQMEHQFKTKINLKGESTSKQATLRCKRLKKLLKNSFNKREMTFKPPISHESETLQVCLKNENNSLINSLQIEHQLKAKIDLEGESTSKQATLGSKRPKKLPKKSFNNIEVSSESPISHEFQTLQVCSKNEDHSKMKSLQAEYLFKTSIDLKGESTSEKATLRCKRPKKLPKESVSKGETNNQHKAMIDSKSKNILEQATLECKHLKKLSRKSFNKEEVTSEPPTSDEFQTSQVCSKNEDDSQMTSLQTEHQLKPKIDLEGDNTQEQTTLGCKRPKKLPKRSFNIREVTSKPHISNEFQTLQVCSRNQDDSQMKFLPTEHKARIDPDDNSKMKKRLMIDNDSQMKFLPTEHKARIDPEDNSKMKKRLMIDKHVEVLRDKISRSSNFENKIAREDRTKLLMQIPNGQQTKLEKTSLRSLEIRVERTSHMGVLVDVGEQDVQQNTIDKKKKKCFQENVIEESTCVKHKCSDHHKKVVEKGKQFEEEEKGFEKYDKKYEEKNDTKKEQNRQRYASSKRNKRRWLESNVAQEVKYDEVSTTQEEQVIREASMYAPTTVLDFDWHEVQNKNQNDKGPETFATSFLLEKPNDSEGGLLPEDGFVIDNRLGVFPSQLYEKDAHMSANPIHDSVLEWDLEDVDKPMNSDDLHISLCNSLASASEGVCLSYGVDEENLLTNENIISMKGLDVDSCSMKFICARERPSEDHVPDLSHCRDLMIELNTAHVVVDYSCLRKIINKPVIKYKIVLSRKLVSNARRELWSKRKPLNGWKIF